MFETRVRKCGGVNLTKGVNYTLKRLRVNYNNQTTKVTRRYKENLIGTLRILRRLRTLSRSMT